MKKFLMAAVLLIAGNSAHALQIGDSVTYEAKSANSAGPISTQILTLTVTAIQGDAYTIHTVSDNGVTEDNTASIAELEQNNEVYQHCEENNGVLEWVAVGNRSISACHFVRAGLAELTVSPDVSLKLVGLTVSQEGETETLTLKDYTNK